MKRAVFLYAGAIALAAFALAWVEFSYVTRVFSGEIYVILIALAFTGLGVWAGARLTPSRRSDPFARNEAALRSLGVTAREYEVLERIAAGRANKEIARDLGVSPNTVKTHAARLYEKLEARRRTEAVEKARALGLIP